MRNILLPIETGVGMKIIFRWWDVFGIKKGCPFSVFYFWFFFFIYFVFSVFLFRIKIQYNKSPLTGRKFRHEEDE
jgi:hypothetical protein